MFDVRVLWWAAALCIMCQGSNSVQASSRVNSHLTSPGLTLQRDFLARVCHAYGPCQRMECGTGR
jgi:hypothetical protein